MAANSIFVTRSLFRFRNYNQLHFHINKLCSVRSTEGDHVCGVEVSKAEWPWVQRVLPTAMVPEPPKHDVYPTPSGFVPQTVKEGDLEYFVQRTRFHNMPIYLEERDGGSRKLTTIRLVQGNIWAFEKDVKQYLSERLNMKVYTQVDEFTNKVRVRGIYLEEVKDFLLEKGL